MRKRKKKMNVKLIVAVMSFVLLFGGTLGGSLAWLLDNTGDVKNTFTTSDISVELKETKNEFKMIPGWTIDKDPIAKVSSGSEDCYLFVKIEKSANFSDYLDCAIDEQWTPLEDDNGVEVPGVYYIEIDNDGEKNFDYNILGAGTATYSGVKYTWEDNQVLVKPTVTKQDMSDALSENPTLTFTAYAVQLYKNSDTKFTATEAWQTLSSGTNS